MWYIWQIDTSSHWERNTMRSLWWLYTFAMYDRSCFTFDKAHLYTCSYMYLIVLALKFIWSQRCKIFSNVKAIQQSSEPNTQQRENIAQSERWHIKYDRNYYFILSAYPCFATGLKNTVCICSGLQYYCHKELCQSDSVLYMERKRKLRESSCSWAVFLSFVHNISHLQTRKFKYKAFMEYTINA